MGPTFNVAVGVVLVARLRVQRVLVALELTGVEAESVTVSGHRDRLCIVSDVEKGRITETYLRARTVRIDDVDVVHIHVVVGNVDRGTQIKRPSLGRSQAVGDRDLVRPVAPNTESRS